MRRRACEALIRCNLAAPLPALWPLLRDPDRFVRTAARLAVQRQPAKDWAKALLTEENDLAFLEGTVALCKIDQAAPYAEALFEHLHKGIPEDAESQLQYLRTLELVLLHTPAANRPGSVRGIALECEDLFPSKDNRVSRELALLLTYFRRDNTLAVDEGVAVQDHQGAGGRQGRPRTADPLFLLSASRCPTAGRRRRRMKWRRGTRARATGRAATASPATCRTSSRRRWSPTTSPTARRCWRPARRRP